MLSYWDVLLVIWHFTLVNCNDKSDAEMTTLWQWDSLNHVLCGGGTYAWCRDDTFTRFQTIWMIHKSKKKERKLFEWSKHVGIFHFTGAFKIFSFLKSKTCWWNKLLNQCCLWNLYAPRNQMMCRVNYFIVVHSNSENMIVTYHLACHHKNRSLFFFLSTKVDHLRCIKSYYALSN